METKHIGDSYDLVKRSLLDWLQDLGEWSIEPMLTEDISEAVRQKYEKLLGAKALHSDVLNKTTDRNDFFKRAKQARCHLLIDPHTGISLGTKRTQKVTHLGIAEIKEIISARREYLTLVFDQSVPWVSDESRKCHLRKKLETFDFPALYYFSHAPVLLASPSYKLFEAAKNKLSDYLPDNRILSFN